MDVRSTSHELSMLCREHRLTNQQFLKFAPPSGQTCIKYMTPYINRVGNGYLADENATDMCSFCQISDTNVFLSAVNSNYSDRWRNFGIMWAYVVFNVFAALFLYWLVRVPKKSVQTKEVGAPLTGLDVVEKEKENDGFVTPDESPHGDAGLGTSGLSEKKSLTS